MTSDPATTTPAVYVQILGGLGNQMFQYASGRGLANRLGCPLKLDLTAMAQYDKWPYRLDLFGIDTPVAPAEELERMFPRKSPLRRQVEKRILGRRDPPRQRGVFQEPYWRFTPEFFAQKPPVLLHGYWASPKYFADLREELLQTLTLREPLSDASQAILRSIEATTAISVHVRRGDYVSDSYVRQFLQACNPDYYRRAIELMRGLYPDVTFFVFTDDPGYVRSLFEFCPDYRLVEGNEDRPAEDIMLMSRCRHHIIANSTFSWWGAWLNPRPEKRVIAPRRWFSDPALGSPLGSDLVPDDWILMA